MMTPDTPETRPRWGKRLCHGCGQIDSHASWCPEVYPKEPLDLDEEEKYLLKYKGISYQTAKTLINEMRHLRWVLQSHGIDVCGCLNDEGWDQLKKDRTKDLEQSAEIEHLKQNSVPWDVMLDAIRTAEVRFGHVQTFEEKIIEVLNERGYGPKQ